MADAAAPTAKTPADFLKSIKGRHVVVKLNSGVDYRGILACLDGYMNIAMEQTEVCAPHNPVSPGKGPQGWAATLVLPSCQGCHSPPHALGPRSRTTGVREWAEEEQVRGHLHPRQQRCVAFPRTTAACLSPGAFTHRDRDARRTSASLHATPGADMYARLLAVMYISCTKDT